MSLDERYATDCQVAALTSATAALTELERTHARGDEVALLVADQWMSEMTGVEFLTRPHHIQPAAKRALLIDVGDQTTSPAILSAMALGRIDYYLLKPWSPPDDLLHPLVTELLAEWVREHRPRAPLVENVGEQWD